MTLNICCEGPRSSTPSPSFFRSGLFLRLLPTLPSAPVAVPGAAPPSASMASCRIRAPRGPLDILKAMEAAAVVPTREIMAPLDAPKTKPLMSDSGCVGTRGRSSEVAMKLASTAHPNGPEFTAADSTATKRLSIKLWCCATCWAVGVEAASARAACGSAASRPDSARACRGCCCWSWSFSSSLRPSFLFRTTVAVRAGALLLLLSLLLPGPAPARIPRRVE
mmetsp:Transcript_39678/g.84899  ORF Transcript_39678/g.84899 Transcript_39678/m.84899 type:complete len:222 (+) Transcript_39678:456-1121(+)